jgi:large subunit ribosomal protein L15
MELQKLKLKSKKRIGRGIAAGGGKTAGRGTKGQKSRTGKKKTAKGFEGGQTPLKMRLPKKKGFKSRRPSAVAVNLGLLEERFEDGAVITFEKIREIPGLKIRSGQKKFKILAGGIGKKRFKFEGDFAFSESARKAGVVTAKAPADTNTKKS